ncbi:MAG: S-layer homology domain-containing protein [Firmicutes bacterium]|nr:S-layer homology domain-containing protein [Bacillota bacterium]
MKRFLAILVSAVMIIGMALPVLASPFSDLPDSHWASDAVKMLAALGIVLGYPDGSFKGRNQATRYEVALMVARALEYLDKDIRDLTERLNQLQGQPVSAQPEPGAGEVVLQAPTPDATILEQVIAEKIAGMSEAQWEEFDDRLSALLARIDDLSESNKAEHAALWKALEARQAGSAGDEGLKAEMELALRQQKAELMMAFYDSITAANDERDQAIERLKAEFEQALLDQQASLMASLYDVLEAYKGEHEIDHAALEAKLEGLLAERAEALDSAFKKGIAELRGEAGPVSVDDTKIAGLKAEFDQALLDQQSTLMASLYDVLEAYKGEHEIDHAELEVKFEALLGEQVAALESALREALAELRDEVSLAMLEQKAELTMAFYDSIQALKDEYEQRFESLGEQWEVALLEQKAELTMAFYDSVQALKDENEQKFAAIEANWERALLEQKAELTMAFYDSIAALRDANEQRFAAIDQESAVIEERWGRALLEQKAELTMAFYDSIAAVRDENEQKLASMEETWEVALLEQKAELTMAFYDSTEALKDEYEQRFAAIEEKWEVALLEQKAELTMAFYDSIEALKDEYEQRFASLEERWEIALLEQKAELTMAFYDSLAAERDARARALDEFAAMHEQDLIDAKAEMSAAVYDALEAVRGEFAIEIDVIMAVIDSLRTEYDTELRALGARIDAVDAALNARMDALEAEVADVRALADQNAFDIIDTYHKLKTEDIAPLAERVDKLEESTAAAHADIKALRGDFNKVRIGGTNELKFVDIDLDGDTEAVFAKDPFYPTRPYVSPYKVKSKLENTLDLQLKLQPKEDVNINVGIEVVTDVFDKRESAVGLFSGDVDATITTPRDVTKITAGAISRPRNFTKYQISALEFEIDDGTDSEVRGITADYTRGDLILTGMIAKLNPSEYAFQYALGAGAQFKLTDNLTVGARVLDIRNDNLSGGIYGPDADSEEIAFGGDFALKLSDTLSVTGETSLWKTEEASNYLVAHNLGAQGKLGFLNIEASHEQVEEGYKPRFRGIHDGLDDEFLEDNIRTSKLTITTDEIRGFVVTGEAAREGDAYYAGKDKFTYGAELAYNTKLLAADLTLRSGVEQVNTVKPAEDAGVATTAQLGFDVAYKPIEAGFTWERGIESNEVGYIGYAKADIPFGDALTLKGGWEQRFGSKEYYKYDAGLVLSLPVVPDKVTLGAEAGYMKATGVGISKAYDRYARWLMKGDLAWQITPATEATGTASYEWRAYDDDVLAERRSGEYLQLGLAVAHKLFDTASLNFKYDLKDVNYTEYPSYVVRILELSLKTEF